MRVDQIMSKSVRTCGAGDTLAEAARVMWEADCGAVPVLGDDDRVVAMITDRDACMAAYTRGLRLEDMRVRDAMSRRLVSCKPDDELESAEGAMQAARVRRLPVLDEGDRLVGILSLSDIARALPRERAVTRRREFALKLGETLGAICEPVELPPASA